nr:MAG TPA: hypothetical protein [Crassvirales sp.]
MSTGSWELGEPARVEDTGLVRVHDLRKFNM